MKNQVDHIRGWAQKADDDWVSARMLLHDEGPSGTVCFLAQQAPEKYLKTLLVFVNAPFPHTHDLSELRALCLAAMPQLDLPEMDLSELGPYAVRVRYDTEFWPDASDATVAVEIAERVREQILAVLPPEARPGTGNDKAPEKYTHSLNH